MDRARPGRPSRLRRAAPRRGGVCQAGNAARSLPVECQLPPFRHGCPFFCHESTRQMERIRSGLQVHASVLKAIKVKEETWTKQDKWASLLCVFQAFPRSISSLLYSPSKQDVQQQREGCSCCSGCVSVDSDDGTTLSCGLTGLSPCKQCWKEGNETFSNTSKSVYF
ncbi:uncharacterized protein [Ciconia boyciana]|uniref:uncharacterized protein isoform X5 n=1 Tax=Ciconia boyciana TaxID=52775 RepID=UPI003BA3967B